MKMSREINLLIAGGMVVLGLCCLVISVYTIQKTSRDEMAHIREMLLAERQTQVKDLVANAYSVLETANFYEPTQRAISEMRFGEKRANNFFVFDTDGMFWVQPSAPEMVGEVHLDATDAEGRPYVADMIRMARDKGEGFINYKVQREGRVSPSTRLTYFRLFPKWNWILGTGIYIDDIEQILAGKEAEIASRMRMQALTIAGIILITVLLAVLISSRQVRRRIVEPLLAITHAAERIGVGDFSVELNVNSNKEINQLAAAVKRMQNSLAIAIDRLKKASPRPARKTNVQ